jgi:hypothetical protein
MKKKLLLLLCCVPVAASMYAQGWVGNGSSAVFPVNSSLGLTPLSVGVGTNSPAAQLHTTGSVRLAGITQNDIWTKIMALDSVGNVFWRDASTLGPNNAWLLNGNNVTSANFLGTLNNEKLRFRVNNIERMLIDPIGNVGIGESNPNYVVTVKSDGNSFGSVDRRVLLSLRNISSSVDATSSLRFETVADSSRKYANISLHSPQYNIINDYKNTLVINTYTDSGIAIAAGPVFADGLQPSYGKIRFYTGTTNFSAGGNPNIERMRIAEGGNIGINTKVPSAILHVNGTVRLQNLPAGTGSVLVVDNAGNVFRSTSNARTTELEQEVADLKAQLANLIANRLTALQNANQLVLQAIAPNPAGSNATFKYSIPADISNAVLHIYNVQGSEVKNVRLSARGQNSFTMQSSELAKGIYLAIITGDGQVSNALRMVISR